MKKAKIIFMVIVGIVVLYGVIGLLLPNKYSEIKSTTIKADSETVISSLSDMSNFNLWNPWYGLDTAIIYNTGKEKSNNDIIYWSSQLGEIGSGWAKVKHKSLDTLIIELNYGRQGFAQMRFISTNIDFSNSIHKCL